VLPHKVDPAKKGSMSNHMDNHTANQPGNQMGNPRGTQLPDNGEHVRSIGGVPIQEAAEPIEHMTETYDPDQEDDGDVSTENHRE
jgi:hypothetical protein